jgi:RHS repeat-associated protein
VETITDPEGMTTGLVYDFATGDLLFITVDQGRLNFISQITYDAVGNLTQMTDPLGHTTAFQYDPMRRLIQSTAPSPLNYATKYAYDPDGNLIKVENETGDAPNPWQTTVISYTPTGNMETVTDPEGHVTTYQYDQRDRLWKVTDAENQTTQYLYNPLGRIYQVIDGLGNINKEYTYTPNGQEASLKDANGNETQYEYDGFDRLNKTIFPDGSYEVFTHDAADNLIQKRTRAGSLIGYGYDNLNRLARKILPGSNTIQYGYDLAGRLKDVTGQDSTIHQDFDTAGRLISVTYPDGKSVGYAYDAAGNRTRLTYPDNYYVTYTYDALNRLTGVFEKGSTPLAQYAYDPLSRRTNLTYANATSASYSYEIDGDLSALSHQFSGSSATFTYAHNKIGNRTGQIVNDDRYLFKPATSMDVAYVSNSLNQYTSVAGVSFGYDGNGNLTSDGVNSYTYDVENRLTAALTPTQSATYAYDPFGRRIEKTVVGVTTKYLHDGDQVIMEYGGSGQLLRRYVYGPGIDEPICMKTASSAYYYHFDALGSVIALTGSNGQRVETYAYSPYGKVNQPSSLGNPYLYTGRRYDYETGLYYYRARFYNLELGRFLQVDPIGYRGINLYSYVHNSPVNYIDPLGLQAELGDPTTLVAAGLLGLSTYLIVCTTAPVWVPITLAAAGIAIVWYGDAGIPETVQKVGEAAGAKIKKGTQYSQQVIQDQKTGQWKIDPAIEPMLKPSDREKLEAECSERNKALKFD